MAYSIHLACEGGAPLLPAKRRRLDKPRDERKTLQTNTPISKSTQRGVAAPPTPNFDFAPDQGTPKN
ncbi:hypothetical protein MTP99_018112 [Tenebrio molitor]|nr:hypothetical protein MTP99_018112 [Tenebrio molitor]